MINRIVGHLAVLFALLVTSIAAQSAVPANADVYEEKTWVTDPTGDAGDSQTRDIQKVELSDNAKRVYVRFHMTAIKNTSPNVLAVAVLARPGVRKHINIFRGRLMNRSTGNYFCGGGRTITKTRFDLDYVTISFPKGCVPKFRLIKVSGATDTLCCGSADTTRWTDWLRIRS